MKFDLTRPCADCPFRTDKPFYLHPDRAREIAASEGQFKCHKTLDYADDDSPSDTENTQACAGAILMQEHEERPNQMLRIAERLGLYDATKMDRSAPVFKSRRAFIAANAKRHKAVRASTNSGGV